ncbi:MAG: CPBP family intramembrane glutamic endopeptidase [Promethearchaeota archaeon]
MGKLIYKKKKIILKERFRFLFIEVIWFFIVIFGFLFLSISLLDLIFDDNSVLYGILFYFERAILILLAVPVAFFISKFLSESQKREIILEEDISPSKGFFRLYKITKKNYKYQLLYGFLIFLLVFLPLDFFTYLLVPDMINYQAISLGLKTTNVYLFEDYFIFLIAVILIQFCISFSEETISRGFITKRGSEQINRISAVLIASLYWGLGHFAYFFDDVSRDFPFWFPFIWFIEAFIIGIILSLLVLRRKWIFPVILAHALNNIVSAHVLWNFLQGNDFATIALYLYYPLLIFGIELLIWQFPRIKESFSIGFNLLKSYFKNEREYVKSFSDKLFLIFIDVLIGVLAFLIGFFLI